MYEFFNLNFWVGLISGGLIVLWIVITILRTRGMQTSAAPYYVEDRYDGIGWVIFLLVAGFIAFVVYNSQVRASANEPQEVPTEQLMEERDGLVIH